MIDVTGKRFLIFRDLPIRDDNARSRGITAEGKGNKLEFIASEKPRDGFPGVDEMEVFEYAGGIAKADPGITAHEISLPERGGFEIAALAGGVVRVMPAEPLPTDKAEIRAAAVRRNQTGAKLTFYVEHDAGPEHKTPESDRLSFESFARAKECACKLANARSEAEASTFAAGVLQWGAGTINALGLPL